MQTTPHGWQIIDADAGVLALTYQFGPGATANCFVAKLASGGLLVISPPPKISTQELEDLAAFGTVEAIATNNGFHHLGLGRWRELFPNARLFAAPGAAERIAKKSNNAGELEPLSALQPLLGDDVAVVETPASKCGETWARAKIQGGYAWYASDILANMDLPPKFMARMLFKLTKSAPGYRVFHLAHKFMATDKRAVLQAMLDDVRQHPPTVMIPAHGEILDAASVAQDTENLLVAETG
ncbi:hypothetical protein DB30_03515 [Enhygromyxa salina]|uniref:Metallo-beta-lactamase domain-containing protein n=1 Tax=Enhygromyxa salina TaxID=215803 RepID=A0A0C2DBY0_9BACT|nr:hypothetical protein [Enhygromyxa salina]KIG17202.1 hypothetical protein DB30_03515 [Enhygromyxa salina]